MVSYRKSSLILAVGISAPAVSAHDLFPKDFDVEKFRAELVEIRANSNEEDFLDGHEFIAPGPDDERSPCPFINAMANHGFINRNGKDIPIFDIAKLAPVLYDLPEIGFIGIANAAIYAGQTTLKEEDGVHMLNLDDLWLRPGEERDASLVFPNPGTIWPQDILQNFDPDTNRVPNWDQIFQKARRTVDENLLESLLSKNPDSDLLTVDDMRSHLFDRIFNSLRDDQFFLFGNVSGQVASAQYHLPVFILGDGKDNDFSYAKKEDVRGILLEDRLPDGYMPRSMRYPDDFDAAKYAEANFANVAANGAVIGQAIAAALGPGPDKASNIRGSSKLETA